MVKLAELATTMRSGPPKARGAKARVAGADYVLVFTKSGENPQPIKHPTGLKRLPVKLKFLQW